MSRRLLALLVPLLLRGGADPARTPLRPLRAPAPPVLDGRLDDPVWQSAPSVTDFETFIPEFGKKQPERTVAYMAYDADNLYFAFRCFDPEPSKIKAAMSKRDDMAKDDFVCINLDTFGDQQSLYAFYVNPLGVQGDSRFASGREDFSVDLVWDSAARIDAEGYAVEIRIPLKSIRYTHGDVVRMAVFFERTIARRGEHGSFPALDPARGYAFLPQMAPMEYAGVKRPLVLELLPAFTYAQTRVREEDRLVKRPDAQEWSLTAKYGITPSLILDATVNPDFSQVEADAGQIDANLRFGLFFAEKRPFFLEGSESYNVAGTSFGPLKTVVHTRTIQDPRWGAKLSGKLRPDDTVAVLAAVDAPSAPPQAPPGTPDPPSAQVSVLRYKLTTREDGYLGAFLAARDQDGRRNRVYGPDGQVRLGPSDMLSWHAFGSSLREAEGAETRSGHALGLELQHDTSRLAVNAAFHEVSEDFAADTGFLTRSGIALGTLSATPKFYPKGGWFRRLDATAGASGLKDRESGLMEEDRWISLTGISRGNASVTLAVHDATEVFLGRRFGADGISLSARNQFSKSFTLQGSYWRGQGIRYVAEPFQGRGSTASLTATLQPTENLAWTLAWSHADFFRSGSGEKVYDYHIYRSRLVYQVDRYLFFRAVLEYNAYRKQLLTDFLASYTYIPGTVLYLGYGSLYRKQAWEAGEYRPASSLLEMQRGLFFKASYLWRF